MNKRIWSYCLGLVAAFASTACGEASLADGQEEEVGTQADALTGGPHLMWHNTRGGDVSAWVLSGSTVTGTQALDRTCGWSGDCSDEWEIIDTLGSSILWYSWRSGLLSTWNFSSTGHVTVGNNLTWTCDFDTAGCAAAWRPIGRVSLKPKTCSGICLYQKGLLWHNSGTGELSIWLIAPDGYTVTGSKSLSWRCSEADGCSLSSTGTYAAATADFDGDGSSDVLWYSRATGRLSVWLIKDASGAMKGSQTLSWTNPPNDWYLRAAGDANGDGRTDVLWHNRTTGVLSSWLLNGQGTVTGTQNLSWTCGGSACNDWWTAGYVTFPAAVPPPR